MEFKLNKNYVSKTGRIYKCKKIKTIGHGAKTIAYLETIEDGGYKIRGMFYDCELTEGLITEHCEN